MKQLIYTYVLFCTGLLEYFDVVLLLELLSLFKRDLLLLVQIALVACETYHEVRRGILSQVREPFLGIGEGLAVGGVKDADGCNGISVVDWRHTPVLLLPCSVPDLELSFGTGDWKLHKSGQKGGRNGRLLVRLEGVSSVTLQD